MSKITAVLLIALALSLPCVVRAQGPDGLADWQVIAEGVRVTYYGPRYVGGEIMASGTRYMPDNDTAALGPALLVAVREHYTRQAQLLGHPLAWGWEPSFRLRQSGNLASCYYVPISLDEARLWGCGIRVCAEAATGGWLCREMRVMDTGSSGLEVDLPDDTWRGWWEYPISQGVFTGTVEALQWAPP